MFKEVFDQVRRILAQQNRQHRQRNDGKCNPRYFLIDPRAGPGSRRGRLVESSRFNGSRCVYDKQGTGKSEGSWVRESYDDLAGDALAALKLLRSQPNVDARRVGAWGISQSCWVIPRLAIQDPDVAFVICITGGGSTPREVEAYGYRNELLHNGFTEADWEQARLLIDRYMNYLASGQDRDALLKAIKASGSQKWSSVVNIERVMPDQGVRDKWAWVATYDPLPDIRALKMPVLVFLGGRDPFTPSNVAAQRWLEGLAVAGDPHDRIISYPFAGHGIRINGHDTNAPAVYAPGYMPEQFAWLREIGVLKPGR